MRYPGFLGGSNTNRTMNVDAERTINFYPEIVDGGTPKSKIVLHGTPGHVPFVICGTGPVRCAWYEDGRMFVISGNRLFEVFQSQTIVLRGQVASDGKLASISSNGLGGHQLFITSGGFGYIYDLNANTLTLIVDPDFPLPAVWGIFLDAYFVVLSDDRFMISDLLDGSVWSGLDVAQTTLSSDQKIAMASNHREIWLFGTKRIEAWINTGANAFPFEPIGGAPIDHGIAAAKSAVVMDNTIFWLGADATGAGVVWKASGYTPMRISTHAVETMLHRLPRFDDAIAWVYSQEGHLFYVLYLPAADTTWVYDVASNLWHERAIWNQTTMRWQPHVGIVHTYAWGMNLVGDRQSGAIYKMDLDVYCDRLVDPTPDIEAPAAVESPSPSPSASSSPSRSPSSSESPSVSPSGPAPPGASDSPSPSPSSSASPSTGTDTYPDDFDLGSLFGKVGNTWYSNPTAPTEITGIDAPADISVSIGPDPNFTDARVRIYYANETWESWGYWSDWIYDGDIATSSNRYLKIRNGDFIEAQVYTGNAGANNGWITIGGNTQVFGVTTF